MKFERYGVDRREADFSFLEIIVGEVTQVNIFIGIVDKHVAAERERNDSLIRRIETIFFSECHGHHILHRMGIDVGECDFVRHCSDKLAEIRHNDVCKFGFLQVPAGDYNFRLSGSDHYGLGAER